MKKTWQTINNVLGKNQRKSGQSVFKDEHENTITNSKDISNGFNDFFVNVGPKLASNISSTGKQYYEYLKDMKSSSKFFRPIVE